MNKVHNQLSINMDMGMDRYININIYINMSLIAIVKVLERVQTPTMPTKRGLTPKNLSNLLTNLLTRTQMRTDSLKKMK